MFRGSSWCRLSNLSGHVRAWCELWCAGTRLSAEKSVSGGIAEYHNQDAILPGDVSKLERCWPDAVLMLVHRCRVVFAGNIAQRGPWKLRCLTDVGLVFAQRLRRYADTNPTLGQHVIPVGKWFLKKGKVTSCPRDKPLATGICPKAGFNSKR